MQIYDLNALQVGLTYLAYGVGCGVASYVAGTALLIRSLWSSLIFDISIPYSQCCCRVLLLQISLPVGETYQVSRRQDHRSRLP